LSPFGNDRRSLRPGEKPPTGFRRSLEGRQMTLLRKFKVAMLLVLIGIGLSGSLTACVFDDGWHGDHERHWR
jgi:hypothetical protein